jgi:leucyl-tRNA synthetase
VRLVPEEDLPVVLPELEDYRPSGEFETPLSKVTEWVATKDPDTGAPARRDANTMPQWAGSCWYFLRFCDPHNEEFLISEEAERYWMPVDLYVGGAEHAVLHLLYARFWHKVLFDLGVVHTKEPFKKLLNPGMILGRSYRYYDDNLSDEDGVDVSVYGAEKVRIDGERMLHAETEQELKARYLRPEDVVDPDGTATHPSHSGLELELVTEKMSKSRGNVVSPDDVIEAFGADSMRLYELFMGPLEKGAPWSTDGIPGCFRFLQRAHRAIIGQEGKPPEIVAGAGTEEQARLTAITIAGVTGDLEQLQMNTAISKLMVWVRDINRDAAMPREGAEAFARLLSPFAPHLAESLWEALGHKPSVALAPWPEADAALLVADTQRLAVQVNGKRRDEIEVDASASDEDIRAAALAAPGVVRHLAGKAPRKVIVVKGRLVNVVG